MSKKSLNNTWDMMREVRNTLGSVTIFKIVGIKTGQLARYCRDQDQITEDPACKDPFQRIIDMMAGLRKNESKDLEFTILSAMAAPSGYKLVPIVPEGCTKKASTLEACLESSQALVTLHTSMCAFDGIGVVSNLADKAHKAIDLSVSKWMKAKEDKETPKRTALSKLFEEGYKYEEEE